ncbi:MAG: 2-succinyl-6-hydroxy-2,4-cyclohexadiene-1-carboxylate synthase, partial [Longimicrobiales bacterium]|nr:2-succinyl-6-hydroxy-2,4-cyclohexadiene-1-carboxylate synthase [Longimicrobiales bacterium]
LDDDVRMHVLDRGSGPATLLVHGFTGSVGAWGEEILRGLTDAGRRVLAVDLPGHGLSDTPPDPERYDLPRVARDLTVVLDRLEISRPDWIGYSMGGRIALGAAVLHPDRVGRLILEGASAGIEDEARAEERRRADEALAERILAEGMERFVDEWMAKPVFRTQSRLPDSLLEAERDRRLTGDPLGLANTLRGLGTGHQPSFWGDLSRIRAPTLLLTGADDEKFTGIARRMADRIPEAIRVTVPRAGHTVHLERPEAWLAHVTRFLSGRASGGDA